MKANILKEIIESISNNKVYTTEINGTKKDLSGLSFKGHIISIKHKMNDEDANALLDSLKPKEVDKKAIKDLSPNLKEKKDGL